MYHIYPSTRFLDEFFLFLFFFNPSLKIVIFGRVGGRTFAYIFGRDKEEDQ